MAKFIPLDNGFRMVGKFPFRQEVRMRLLDKLLAYHRDIAIEDGLHVADVLCADVVAKHAEDLNDKGGIGYDMAPYSMPPWELTFTEFNINLPNNPFRQFGTMTGICEQRVPELRESGLIDWEKEPSPSAEYLVYHNVYATHYVSGAWPLDKYFVWTLDSQGTVLSRRTMDRKRGKFRFAVLEGDFLEIARWMLRVVALSFTFANCANVKLEDATTDLAPSEKIRRRLKLPCVKRYTLNIEGHSTKPRANGEPGQTGVLPFHLCRGHFATYTADKPRLGRLSDGVGRFWIKPHMRGREERGRIEKDYAIAGATT